VVAKISGSNAWWNQFLQDDQELDDVLLGSKMVLLMDILKECAMIGDKLLVFSQSILSLDLIEEFLERIHNENETKKKSDDDALDDALGTWVPGKDYYRMDGSTAAETRKIWCKFFNKADNHRMRLFLISTKAGGLGINLVAANRVIIFDASWNPSHDVQSIFRVFRFGQTKPVYVYRFIAHGTMEEKIYDRQVTKESLSARVVDEHQIDSHFTMNELAELYEFKDEPPEARPTPIVPEDRLLAELVDKHKALVWKIHKHDSLLENKVDENLTEAERKEAWAEFENEKKGYVQRSEGMPDLQGSMQLLQQMQQQPQQQINPMAIQALLRQQYPELNHEELMARTRWTIMELQKQHQQQLQHMMQQQAAAATAAQTNQMVYQQRQQQQQQMQQRQQQQLRQQQQMQQQPAYARLLQQQQLENKGKKFTQTQLLAQRLLQEQGRSRSPSEKPRASGDVIDID
jgi:transcriptional regulator ATRX